MKVKIHKDPFSNTLEFLFYEERDGKRYVALPVVLVMKECQEGEEIKPTFKISGIFSEEFLQSLAEALDEKGIKTNKDAKIEGTLEATRYHLEDLRKMLRLK